MTQFVIPVRTELTVPLQSKRTGANFFTQDNMANRIEVEVTKHNVLQTLVGDVMGYVIRDDKVTVFFPGGIEDGKAYIELPEEAYAVVGPVSIAVRITPPDGKKVTIAIVEAYVKRYTTDAYSDSAHVISGIDDLLANLDRIDQLAQLMGQVSGIVDKSNSLTVRTEAARAEAQQAADNAASSAEAAQRAAADAQLYSRLTGMDAVTHGVFNVFIDDRGHLIFSRTESLADMSMRLQNGRLIIEYPLEE